MLKIANKKLCFILVVMTYLLVFKAYASSLSIRIYPVISIEDKDFSIGIEKIAKLTNANVLAKNELERISTIRFRLPLHGDEHRQYITGAEIKKSLMDALDVKDKLLVEVIVPNRVLVKINNGIDISNTVADVAKNALMGYLDKYYEEGKVNLVAVPEISQSGTLNYIPRKIEEPIKKRTVVWIDVYRADTLVQSVPVWFDVKARAQVFILKSSVAKGDPVSLSNLDIKLKDIGDFSGVVRVDDLKDKQLVDFVYVRNASKGTILDYRLMQKFAAVNFGDNVKVISKVGNVVITTNAIAQSRANIGGSVKLRVMEGQEEFSGKVIAEKQVLIEQSP